MQSFKPQRFYSLRADANALGGYQDAPIERDFLTVAPVSLPPVGGFAKAQATGSTLGNIVAYTGAYTEVRGREHAAEGYGSIQVAAVVEGLNILDKVRATRIETKLTITLPVDARPIGISLDGTCFEGLWINGRDCRPTVHQRLEGRVTWEEVGQVGREQADILFEGYRNLGEDAHQWVSSRHQWMTSTSPRRGCGYAQASVLTGVEVPGSIGHIVEIPDFGRVILGELLISRDEVQLIGVRVELGCPTSGRITSNAVGGGGVRDN